MWSRRRLAAPPSFRRRSRRPRCKGGAPPSRLACRERPWRAASQAAYVYQTVVLVHICVTCGVEARHRLFRTLSRTRVAALRRKFARRSRKRSRAKRRARVGLVREGGASRDALCVRPLRRDARSDAPNDAHEARRVSHAETRGVQCRRLYALRPQGRQVVPDRTGDLVRVVVTETGICLRRRCMQIPVVDATTLLAGISACMILRSSCHVARFLPTPTHGRRDEAMKCRRLYAKPELASRAAIKITDRKHRASDCKIWIALHAIELRREVFFTSGRALVASQKRFA